MTPEPTTARIRGLNDIARRFLVHGTVYFSHGVAALPADEQAVILDRVCDFDDFKPENDPYGEHDFGAFEHNGYWQPMDTLRDKRNLEALWDSGEAPWKVW